MARTTITIPFTQEQTTADQTARRILAIDGYHEIDYNGEKVWKKGTGLMTAMHYIKLEFQPCITLSMIPLFSNLSKDSIPNLYPRNVNKYRTPKFGILKISQNKIGPKTFPFIAKETPIPIAIIRSVP